MKTCKHCGTLNFRGPPIQLSCHECGAALTAQPKSVPFFAGERIAAPDIDTRDGASVLPEGCYRTVPPRSYEDI